MAKYLGIYTNDIRIRYENVIFNTYVYTNSIRSPTTYNFDDPLLPTNFKNSTTRLDQLQGRVAVCTVDYPSIRKAQCYISDEQYFEIPCPFIGGTEEIKEFFRELTLNNRFRAVLLIGEKLPYGQGLVMRNTLFR